MHMYVCVCVSPEKKARTTALRVASPNYTAYFTVSEPSELPRLCGEEENLAV